MITKKTFQWEDSQFREDEINGELYNFNSRVLKVVTTLNNNAWVDVKMDFNAQDLQRHHAVSPLNCRMTYKDVANSVSKFGGILFTAVACYAAGPLKVRLSFRSRNVPPPPPNLPPLPPNIYVDT
jgi:hypothetical protein